MVQEECLTGPGGGGEDKYEVRQRTVTTGRRLRMCAHSRLGGNTRRWSGGRQGCVKREVDQDFAELPERVQENEGREGNRCEV